MKIQVFNNLLQKDDECSIETENKILYLKKLYQAHKLLCSIQLYTVDQTKVLNGPIPAYSCFSLINSFEHTYQFRLLFEKEFWYSLQFQGLEFQVTLIFCLDSSFGFYNHYLNQLPNIQNWSGKQNECW
ncbi:Hypothetical_protein [Hexamita inflata]|uniref:Hypothetical_protein n=1 Tax=Hexamita inflata TaxID=28002 RepID=A0AA86TIM0_9EUKA|nr:Hypothetical protein HINF_LOCUS1833 [Hexamita inflata]